jgi:predicted nucleic acid-binding protein
MGKKPLQLEFFQYVFDASSLINIERSRRMRVLRSVKGAILIPERVGREVNVLGSALRRFIRACPGVVTPFASLEEEHEYLRFCRQRVIDEGEASAMAIALSRKKTLVIDERETKATGKAREHGIEVLSSQEFVKQHG